MSLSLVPVPLTKIIVPTINIGAKKEYVIAKGPQDSTWQQFQAQNLNNNQINITTNPPSRQHVINRQAFILAQYTLTITGSAGAGGLMVQPGLDAPRAYPISQSLNTLQCTLNNDNFSVTLNQYWNALLRYHHKSSQAQFNSLTPSYLDAYQEYSDFTNPFFGGSNKNALGGYGEVADGDGGAASSGGRGGFSQYQIVSDTGGTAVVKMIVCEPVFMPPWNWSDCMAQGFIGIENSSWTFTFSDLASALWSHNNTSTGHSTISGIAVQINQFEVMLNFLTLPLDLIPPQMSVYPYFEVIPYSTPAMTIVAQPSPPVLPLFSVPLTFNSIQLKSIPQRMYIFAQEDLSLMTFANGGANKTNTFGVISNINITFNNKVGLLSTMSQQQLYAMSQQNGCNLSYPAWSSYVGSIIAIDFSKDLSLDTNLASGLIGNFQLGCIAQVANPRPFGGRSVNYVLWIVVINEGVMNIVNGSVSHQVGVFDSSNVLSAPVNEMLSWKKTQQVYGGDFFSSIGDFFTKTIPSAFKKGIEVVPGIARKAYDFAKQVQPSKYLEMIQNPYAQSGATTLKQIGLGVSAGIPAGGRRRMKRRRAGVLVTQGEGLEGGRFLNRNELQDRLMGDGLENDEKSEEVKEYESDEE